MSCSSGSRLADALTARRQVWFEGTFFDTPVYQRDLISIGAKLQGPCILAQLDTTVVIEPADHAHVDNCGNVIIEVARADQ
jgi:N-methylhydantoinase A